MEKQAMGFNSQQRLLIAADYKNVFDNASIKASRPSFLFLATPNNKPHPRLGLIVAKKHVRLATQRNRIKRLIRESFRQQKNLPPLDVVVLVRSGQQERENTDIHEDLMVLWRQLKKRYEKASQKTNNT